MNDDVQLRLQAYLDGELTAAVAAESQALVARDADAQALLAELRNTRAALAGHEAGMRLPESREFFWSKIEREIQHAETTEATVREREAARPPWWRRQIAALAGTAALAVLLTVALTRTATPAAAEMELSSDDLEASTFRDQDQQMTVVWFDDRPDASELTQPVPLATVRPE